MAKKKLARFAEMRGFDNVVQAGDGEVYNKRHPFYGRWAGDFFGNANPVVLELGCGKGEYSVGLAGMFPDRNFIGVDIKGARIWKGAKYAIDNKIDNVGFVRTRIEFIPSFFAPGEIEQVWLTFPDPQPKRSGKRLTSAGFLNRYRRFLQPGGVIHLKTDSVELYRYTLAVIRANGLGLLQHTADLYGRGTPGDMDAPERTGVLPGPGDPAGPGQSAMPDQALPPEAFAIKTFYEQQYLDQGKPICYLRFRIDGSREIIEPDEE